MTNPKCDIVKDLQARGLLEQSTDLAELQKYLNEGSRTLYCGFDPTADSLHIGSLVPLLVLKRFQAAGHKPIVLVGGATGLIGDPSGKAEERTLNDDKIVAGWAAKLKSQTSQFVDFDCGANSAETVNNLDWIGNMTVPAFLRDIGKHFSVNNMMNKESVKGRLTREGVGMSFTEFSYSVLQGLDFLELYRQHNCTLQIGGNDQWGNIVAGVDLIRKMEGFNAQAITLPLVVKADGTKFGKTETGTIWLSSRKTSAYAFYQFWLNTSDADVEKFLKYFTFLDMAKIADVVAKHNEAPHLRHAQKILAREVTELVHSHEGLVAAERITGALFGGELSDLTKSDLAQLSQDGMESAATKANELQLLEALIVTGAAGSKREAREFVQAGAVLVNGEKVQDGEFALSPANSLHGGYHVLKRGKKEFRLLCWGGK